MTARKRPITSGRAPIPGLRRVQVLLLGSDLAWLRAQGEVSSTLRALIAEKRATEE